MMTLMMTLLFLTPFILSKCFSVSVKCLRRGSNSHLQFRKPLFYPLNYGDNLSEDNLIRRFPAAQHRKLARFKTGASARFSRRTSLTLSPPRRL